MTPFEKVTGALEAAGSHRLSDTTWTCPVPSHADKDAPLVVIDRAPVVVLECPQCRQGKVLGAIGLRMSDLDGGNRQAGAEFDVARVAELLPGADPKQADGDDQPALKQSQASTLVELAEAVGIELFHTPTEDAYAAITVGTHRETWPVRARPLRRYLARLFHAKHAKVPGSQAIHDAIGVLEGKALFEGAERPVAVRVAAADGAIYLDLGNDAWEMVEITAAGWRVVTEAPVRFRRPGGLAALPHPEPGGKLAELRRFLNVEAADWPLVAGYLVAMVRPTGPYPVLSLLGGQGSAKTTTARALRELVDPNTVGLRSEPRDMRDLAIAAANSQVAAFDNLSSLPTWLSDGICRLATGGGFATRELYSDDQEALFAFIRPVVLTGIEELAVRGDLLDRSILLYLPPIRDSGRRDEATFWAEFRRARPRLLGALLDAVSTALRRLPEVRLERLPRMADFALWVVAAAPALGIDPEGFLTGYAHNRGQANQLALEASPVATEVLAFVTDSGAWAGTAAELLAALNGRIPEEARRARGWPKDATRLSGALRRVQPNLNKAGVIIEFKREATRRWIELEWVGAGASPSSERHRMTPEQAELGDAGGDGVTLPEAEASPAESRADLGKQAHGDAGDAGDATVPTHSRRVRCPECGIRAQLDPRTGYGRRRLDEGCLKCGQAWEPVS